MTKLLHIDSSISGNNSVSRELTAAIVAQVKDRLADVVVTRRDLAVNPLPHVSPEQFEAQMTGPGAHGPELLHALSTSEAVLEEFLAADIVVVGAPMYNFAIPSQLKAWVDRLAVAGKTFRYTETGSQGLVGDKQVLIASSRGGFYGPETTLAQVDHQESYLRAVFGFFGISNLVFFRVEGASISEVVRPGPSPLTCSPKIMPLLS